MTEEELNDLDFPYFEDVMDMLITREDYALIPTKDQLIYNSFEDCVESTILLLKEKQEDVTLDSIKKNIIGCYYLDTALEYSQISPIKLDYFLNPECPMLPHSVHCSNGELSFSEPLTTHFMKSFTFSDYNRLTLNGLVHSLISKYMVDGKMDFNDLFVKMKNKIYLSKNLSAFAEKKTYYRKLVELILLHSPVYTLTKNHEQIIKRYDDYLANQREEHEVRELVKVLDIHNGGLPYKILFKFLEDYSAFDLLEEELEYCSHNSFIKKQYTGFQEEEDDSGDDEIVKDQNEYSESSDIPDDDDDYMNSPNSFYRAVKDQFKSLLFHYHGYVGFHDLYFTDDELKLIKCFVQSRGGLFTQVLLKAIKKLVLKGAQWEEAHKALLKYNIPINPFKYALVKSIQGKIYPIKMVRFFFDETYRMQKKLRILDDTKPIKFVKTKKSMGDPKDKTYNSPYPKKKTIPKSHDILRHPKEKKKTESPKKKRSLVSKNKHDSYSSSDDLPPLDDNDSFEIELSSSDSEVKPITVKPEAIKEKTHKSPKPKKQKEPPKEKARPPARQNKKREAIREEIKKLESIKEERAKKAENKKEEHKNTKMETRKEEEEVKKTEPDYIIHSENPVLIENRAYIKPIHIRKSPFQVKEIKVTPAFIMQLDPKMNRNIPDLEYAVRQIVQKPKYSIDQLIRELYPTYAKSLTVTQFTSKVWRILGRIEAQKSK